LIVNATSIAPGITDFRPERRQCDDCSDEKKRCAQLDETKLLMAGGQEPFRDNARRSQHTVNEPIKHRALLVAVLDYVLRSLLLRRAMKRLWIRQASVAAKDERLDG